MAVAMGIAVFYWTGGDTDELRKQGKTIEKQIQEAGRKSEEAVKRLKKDFNEVKDKAGEKAEEKAPEKETLKEAPTSPASTDEPTGPPMEDIDEKDKEKLKGLLKEE